MAPVEGNEEHAREAMWDLTLLISSSAVRMIDAHADEVCVQRMTVHLRSVLFFFKPAIPLLMCKSINPWISAQNYIFLPTQCV